MKLDVLVAELDAYFRVGDVRGDFDWTSVYPDWWPEVFDGGYRGRWNGLMVRGSDEVEQARTCVFPSDGILESLPLRTLLFSEHPIDLEDEPGFLPLSREALETLRARESSFYHVHGPLDQHPEVGPSRLVAKGLGLTRLEEYFPIVEGIPGGAAIIGDSADTVDGLAERLATLLGPEVPVRILSRPREHAGRVAVAAGGGATRDVLEASLERGCQTYVTGNADTRCRLDFVQAGVREFRALADEAGVALIDGTHYGTEKPPQLAMVEWFRARGLEAEFVSEGAKA